MTTFQVKFTDEALNDLLQIVEYIESELLLPKKAVEKKKIILDNASSLSIFPERGKLISQQHNLRFIRTPNDRYLILYQVLKDTQIVAITNILYGSPERLERYAAVSYTHLTLPTMAVV